jgi:hypothetical protein
MIRCSGVFLPGTIMNRAFHAVAMLAVAGHMLFGCCLHHAHALGSPADLPVSVNAVCPCEHHHGHQQEPQPRDEGGNPQGCDEAPCAFTRPDSSESGDVSGGLPCLSLVSCLPSLPTPAGTYVVDSVSSRFGAPIPLHLLNQALLL